MTSHLPLAIAAGAAAGGALMVRERRARQAMERFAGASLETLLNAIEANDPDTGMHVRRVAAYALIIAYAADLDEHAQRAIERVALFHDIGKIHEALFDIVHDDTRLTRAERRAIDTHPAKGAEVLAPLAAFYPELPEGVLSHHERWDGSGYPRRFRGERIPIEARIVAIADTIDAVANSRRYRRGTGVDAALGVVAAGRGTQFDPSFVDLVMLPPVRSRIAREHVTQQERLHYRAGRRSQEREQVPDISFRWRSESLGSRGVRTSRRVD